jgi:hypothetical protein
MSEIFIKAPPPKRTVYYIDVSGSAQRIVEKYLRVHTSQSVADALRCHRHWHQSPRDPSVFYAFSNQVRAWFEAEQVLGGGTQISCVKEHIEQCDFSTSHIVVVTDYPQNMYVLGAPASWEIISFEDFIPEYGLVRELEDLNDQIGAIHFTTPSKRTLAGVEIHMKIEKVNDRLRALPGSVHRTELRNRLHQITRRLLSEGFGVELSKLRSDTFGPLNIQDLQKETTTMATRTPKQPVITPNMSKSSLGVELVNMFSNSDVAAVTLRLHLGHGDSLTAEGVAKRDPNDTPDEVTGVTLAYGRALRKLGNQLTASADQRVRAADKVRRQAEARKAQERALQRKAERKVVAEKSAVEQLAQLRKATKEDQQIIERLLSALDAQSEKLAAVEQDAEARRKAAYAKRVATRKANAAKKTVKGKATARARK